jgi:hypothetical protein
MRFADSQKQTDATENVQCKQEQQQQQVSTALMRERERGASGSTNRQMQTYGMRQGRLTAGLAEQTLLHRT